MEQKDVIGDFRKELDEIKELEKEENAEKITYTTICGPMNGSYCTSYCNYAGAQMKYTFKISTISGGYSHISEKSSMSCSGTPIYYFQAGSVTYVRQTQINTLPAEIKGVGTLKVTDGNTFCGQFALITKVINRQVSVYVNQIA